MKPLKNNIILEPEPEEKKSKGGIILINHRNQNAMRCRVIAVGEGTPEKPMSLKPGMQVYIPRNMGKHIESPEGPRIILPDAAIMVYYS